jgi:hypothetical protein
VHLDGQLGRLVALLQQDRTHAGRVGRTRLWRVNPGVTRFSNRDGRDQKGQGCVGSPVNRVSFHLSQPERQGSTAQDGAEAEAQAKEEALA